MNINSDKLKRDLYVNGASIKELAYSRDYSISYYYITDKSCMHNGVVFDVLKKMVNGSYKVIKTRKNENGYRNFDIRIGEDLRRGLLLHRARWASFKEVPSNDEFVRHLNGDKGCNDLSNLMIGSHHDNSRDVSMSGMMSGSNNPSALIDDRLAMAIYIISNLGLMSKDVVKILPIELGSVYNIKNRKKWNHIHSHYSELIDSMIDLCVKGIDEKCEKKSKLLAQNLKQKLEKEHRERILKVKKYLHSQIDSALNV